MAGPLLLRSCDAQAIQEFAEKVRERLGPHLVGLRLFGSKATGHDAPDSDIDILVAVTDSSTAIEDRVLDAAFEVNLAHSVYISPRVIPQAVLNDPVWRITPFLRSIETQGVPL